MVRLRRMVADDPRFSAIRGLRSGVDGEERKLRRKGLSLTQSDLVVPVHPFGRGVAHKQQP